MKKAILSVSAKEVRDLEPHLTLKQSGFLRRYLETGNATRAALETYDCKNVGIAAVIASENLSKLKSPIKTFLEYNGLSMKALLSVLAGGLSAEKLEDLSGEKVPDHSVRHKYLETAARWLGVEKETNETVSLKRRVVAEEFFDDK